MLAQGFRLASDLGGNGRCSTCPVKATDPTAWRALAFARSERPHRLEQPQG
jgi:hypothetical protein